MSGIVMICQNDFRDDLVHGESTSPLTRSLSQISNKTGSMHSAVSGTAINNSDQSVAEENATEESIYDLSDKSLNEEFIETEEPDSKSDLIADFEKTIKSIAVSHRDGIAPEKLASGLDGVDKLERISAKRIEAVLSDSNREKFIRMNTEGRGQSRFPMALESFLACLSIFNDEELKSNAVAINKLSQDLNTIFRKKGKFTTSYDTLQDSFFKKLDKFVTDFLNKKNANIDSVLLTTLKDQVLTGEHGNYVASIFNKKNDVNDVFNKSLDGYLKGLKKEASSPPPTYYSQKLTHMLHETFAFRDILEVADFTEQGEDVEPDNQNQPEDYETSPDAQRRNSVTSLYSNINELSPGSNALSIENFINRELNLQNGIFASGAFTPAQRMRAIEAGPSGYEANRNVMPFNAATDLSTAKLVQTAFPANVTPEINNERKIIESVSAPDTTVLPPEYSAVTAEIERPDISSNPEAKQSVGFAMPVPYHSGRSMPVSPVTEGTNSDRRTIKPLQVEEQVQYKFFQQPENAEFTNDFLRTSHPDRLTISSHKANFADNLAMFQPLRSASTPSLTAAEVAASKNDDRRRPRNQLSEASASSGRKIQPAVNAAAPQPFRSASAPSLTAAEVASGKNADRRWPRNQLSETSASASSGRTIQSAVNTATPQPFRSASAPSLTAAEVAAGKNADRKQLMKRPSDAEASLNRTTGSRVNLAAPQLFRSDSVPSLTAAETTAGRNSDRRWLMKRPSDAEASLNRTTESRVNLASPQLFRSGSVPSLTVAEAAAGRNSDRRWLLQEPSAAPIYPNRVVKPDIKPVISKKLRRASTPSVSAVEVAAGTNPDRRMIQDILIKTPQS